MSRYKLIVTFFLCMGLSGLWTQLSHQPVLALVATLLLLLAWKFIPKNPSVSADQLAPIGLRSIGWGVLLCLPTLFYFLLTFSQEFPFSGDHDHHLLMAMRLYPRQWILWAGLLLLGATFVLPSRLRACVLLWWPIAWVTSLAFVPAEEYLRYPAGQYLLAAPFNAIGWKFTSLDPLMGARLANVLALPIYLFILRPYFLRRWPDFFVVLLAGVFLWQKDWVYFTASNMLEPWALIFILLALEDAWLTNQAPWQAAGWAALACMFKEQSVFVLAPLLMICLWRDRSAEKMKASLLTAALLSFPFIFYYWARADFGVWRKVNLLPVSEAMTASAFDLLSAGWLAHLGTGGILVMVALITAAIAALIFSPRRIFLAAFFIMLLMSEWIYFADEISRSYLGYARFHYLSWPMLGLSLWALWELKPVSRVWASTLVLLLGLQIATSIDFYATAFEADYHRNYYERTSSPVFFPLKELLLKLPHKSTGHLVINNPLQTHHFSFALPMSSPWLKDFASVKLSPFPPCLCERPQHISLVLLPYEPVGTPATLKLPGAIDQARMRSCLASLKSSCSVVQTSLSRDGQLIGLMGRNL